MSFESEWITFGGNGQHTGFCAWPARAVAPVPAVIVIHDVWGLDRHIEDVALRFARAGYVTLAPDLFAEAGQRPSYFLRPRMEALKEFISALPAMAWGDARVRADALAKLPEPRQAEVRESFGALFTSALGRIHAYVPKLVDAVHYMRTQHSLSKGEKVGSVGYGIGGALSLRLACTDRGLAAAVAYYGNAPPDDQLASVACPLLGLYAGLDRMVNAGIADLVAAMERYDRRFEHHIYDGAWHAFFNDEGPSYHAGASRDAYARTLDFFRRQLS
jgi:carboxymethylenebutenolidase